MLNKLKLKSEFSRNVLTLMTGITIAQAISTAEKVSVEIIYLSMNSYLSDDEIGYIKESIK